MRSRPLTLVTVLIGLAASLIVATCGDDSATTPTPPPPLAQSPNLVTHGDVKRAAVGSPRRAVLLWAQAIQFSDSRTVKRTYTREAIAEAGRDRIEQAVRGIGSTLGRPMVVQTTVVRSRARLRAFIVSYDAKRRPVQRQPVTFDLVRRGKTWLLADPTLLLDTYADIKAAGAPPLGPGGRR